MDRDANAGEMHDAEGLGPEDVREVVRLLDREVAGLNTVTQDLGDVLDAAGHALAEPEPDGLRDAGAEVLGGAVHQRERAVQERGIAQTEAGVGAGPALEPGGGRRRAVRERVGEDAVELGEVVGDGEDVGSSLEEKWR